MEPDIEILKKTNKYEEELTLTLGHIDPNGTLRPDTLLRILQNISINHTRKLGIGRKFCIKNNMTWVIASCNVDITRMPGEGEKLRIQTGIQEYNCTCSVKPIQIFGRDGDIIIKAKAKWALIDLSSKELCKDLKSVLPEHPSIFYDELPYKFERLKGVKNAEEFIYKVAPSDFDLNQHMNNTAYLRIIMDDKGFGFPKKYELTKICINFAKEIPLKKVEELDGNFHVNVLTENKEFESMHVIQSRVDDKDTAKLVENARLMLQFRERVKS